VGWVNVSCDTFIYHYSGREGLLFFVLKEKKEKTERKKEGL
jgi:hypothetical protein